MNFFSPDTDRQAPVTARDVDKLHDQLGSRRPEPGSPKALLYERLETLLTSSWEKAMRTLRNSTPDGLGIIRPSMSHDDPEIEVMEADEISARLDGASSRMELINGVMRLLEPGTQRVAISAYKDFASTVKPDDLESLISLARSQSNFAEMGDKNIRTKLLSGTNTSRRVILPMFDVAGRLSEERSGREITHDEWERSATGTLPVIALMARMNLNVFLLLRNHVEMKMPSRGIRNDETVPPWDHEHFVLWSRRRREIAYLKKGSLQETGRMVLRSAQHELLKLERVGCPGSKIIPSMHAWSLDVARAHLFSRGGQAHSLPMHCDNASQEAPDGERNTPSKVG